MMELQFLHWLIPLRAWSWVWLSLSLLGDYGLFWLACIGILLVFRKTRKWALLALVALLLTFLVNNLGLKNWIGRTRPYVVDPSLNPLVPPLKDFSFPSGHAAISMAVCWIWAKKKPMLFWVSILIGFSRMVLGVHYPSDVVFGWLVGGLLAELVWRKREWIVGQIE